MSTKLSTFEFNIRTNSGAEFICIMPALNYMDAVSKFSTQGFAVTLEGRILLTSAVNDFAVLKVAETSDVYKEFAEKHSELLKGLRLM